MPTAIFILHVCWRWNNYTYFMYKVTMCCAGFYYLRQTWLGAVVNIYIVRLLFGLAVVIGGTRSISYWRCPQTHSYCEEWPTGDLQQPNPVHRGNGSQKGRTWAQHAHLPECLGISKFFQRKEITVSNGINDGRYSYHFITYIVFIHVLWINGFCGNYVLSCFNLRTDFNIYCHWVLQGFD